MEFNNEQTISREDYFKTKNGNFTEEDVPKIKELYKIDSSISVNGNEHVSLDGYIILVRSIPDIEDMIKNNNGKPFKSNNVDYIQTKNEYLIGVDFIPLFKERFEIDEPEKAVDGFEKVMDEPEKMMDEFLMMDDLEIEEIQASIKKLRAQFELSKPNYQKIEQELKEARMKMAEIDTVDFSYSDLKNLVKLKEFENVKVLNLAGNPNIENFEGLSIFSDLEELDLSNCNLSEVPKAVLDLTNLKVLNLSKNNIGSLRSIVKHLKNLTSLNVSNNIIKNLPLKIGQLKELQTFNLSYNQFNNKAPKLISRLEKIESLDLTGNHLKKIAKKCGRLTRVSNLKKYELKESDTELENSNLTNTKKERKKAARKRKIEEEFLINLLGKLQPETTAKVMMDLNNRK